MQTWARIRSPTRQFGGLASLMKEASGMFIRFTRRQRRLGTKEGIRQPWKSLTTILRRARRRAFNSTLNYGNSLIRTTRSCIKTSGASTTPTVLRTVSSTETARTDTSRSCGITFPSSSNMASALCSLTPKLENSRISEERRRGSSSATQSMNTVTQATRAHSLMPLIWVPTSQHPRI